MHGRISGSNRLLFLTPALLVGLDAAAGAQTAQYVLTGDGAGDGFGWAAAAAGDVDGDGVCDWIVGAPGAGPGGDETGAARVHRGVDGALLYALAGAESGDRFGFAVGALGDVDGDGRSDVVVGAPRHDAAGQDSGAVYVFSGGDGSLLFSLVGTAGGDKFGYAVAGPGDIDLDGVPDVAVGAPGADVSDSEEGRVYVFSGVDGSLVFAAEGNEKEGQLGAALAGAGDVNLDGRPELVAGAPAAKEGRVVLLSGAGGSPLREVVGDEDGERFGHSVAGAGDVDGDGIPDWLAGAPFSSQSGSAAGRAVLVSGLSGDPLFEVLGPTGGVTLGRSVAGPGDIDGDGTRDFVVGLDEDDTQGANAGAVRVFSGVTGALLLEVLGEGGSYLGSSVAGADVLGDGRVELAAGARRGAGNHGTFSLFALDGDCPDPVVYCQTAPNSVGPGARIGHEGTTSITAADFTLTVNAAPPGQSALFFYGAAQTEIPFGDGFLCVAAGPPGGSPGLFRLNPPITLDGLGQASLLLDFESPPAGSGPGEILPGSTWNFQCWYRDPAAGGAGFNLSDALSATFCP